MKELGITLINSKPYQSQGKGKVERKFLIFQSQLPFYLKLNNAKNIDEANKILEQDVIKHNTTFSRAIKDTPENVFKKSPDIFKDLTKDEVEELENVFTRRSIRTVSKVNEISYNNKIFEVPKF